MAAKAAIQTPRVLRDAQLPHPEERPQGASRRTAAVLLSMRRAASESYVVPTLSEARFRPLPRFDRFGFAVARARSRLQRFQQPARGIRNLLDGAIERRLVRFGRRREAAQLAYELQRGGADFFLRGRGLEIEQRADIPAHRFLLHERVGSPPLDRARLARNQAAMTDLRFWLSACGPG